MGTQSVFLWFGIELVTCNRGCTHCGRGRAHGSVDVRLLGFFSWILEFDKLENISSCLGLFVVCWIFFYPQLI